MTTAVREDAEGDGFRSGFRTTLWLEFFLRVRRESGSTVYMEYPMTIRFTQSCPTCGRRVDVRASLLGCEVACQHCGAEFIASANDDLGLNGDSGEALLARAEAALRRAADMVNVDSELPEVQMADKSSG